MIITIVEPIFKAFVAPIYNKKKISKKQNCNKINTHNKKWASNQPATVEPEPFDSQNNFILCRKLYDTRSYCLEIE